MNRDPLLSCLRGLDIHWWYSVTLETGEIEILMVLTNPFLNIHLHLQSFFASLRYIFSCRVCIYVLFIMYIYMYCTYIYIYHKYVHHELQRFFDLLCTYVLMAIIGRCGHGPTLPQLGKSSLGGVPLPRTEFVVPHHGVTVYGKAALPPKVMWFRVGEVWFRQILDTLW
jgi:hypothetical protein